jgi:hypothetical protein
MRSRPVRELYVAVKMLARTRSVLLDRALISLPLVPAAAFAVHQLRYWLAFGGGAGVQLQQQGHAYMHSLVPWIVLALALALGTFLRLIARALGGIARPHGAASPLAPCG